MVYPRHEEWCCYVYADTRNKARAMLVGYFNNELEYTDFNAVAIRKDVGGESGIYDRDCERLANQGIYYTNDD